MADLRRRARRQGVADGRSGAVVCVRHFGGAVKLNVHFHALVLDARPAGLPGPGGVVRRMTAVRVPVRLPRVAEAGPMTERPQRTRGAVVSAADETSFS